MHADQKMGFWTVTSLVIGGMIGSGVFLLPSALAKFGINGLYSWIITGFGTMVLALVFAGLCARVPKTGGPHTYIEEAFGEMPAFFGAWAYLIACWISVPGIAIGVVTNLAALTPFMNNDYFNLFLQIAVMLTVMFINLQGVFIAGVAEFIFTVLKLIPLVLLPILALPYVDFDTNVIKDLGDVTRSQALTNASIIAMWGYLGVEASTTPAGSVENPTKTIPRALLLGTFVTTIVYILGTYVVMGVIHHSELGSDTTPYATLTRVVFGEGYDAIVSISIALVCLGTLQATVLTTSQISYGAALDNLFPKFFATTNKHHAPIWSIILPVAVIIMTFISMIGVDILAQFALIVEMATVGYVSIYVFCSLAYIVILLRETKTSGRTINLLIAISSLLFSLFIIINISAKIILGFTGLVLLGLPVYLYCKKYY